MPAHGLSRTRKEMGAMKPLPLPFAIMFMTPFTSPVRPHPHELGKGYVAFLELHHISIKKWPGLPLERDSPGQSYREDIRLGDVLRLVRAGGGHGGAGTGLGPNRAALWVPRQRGMCVRARGRPRIPRAATSMGTSGWGWSFHCP